jgi:hypothetical protein
VRRHKLEQTPTESRGCPEERLSTLAMEMENTSVAPKLTIIDLSRGDTELQANVIDVPQGVKQAAVKGDIRSGEAGRGREPFSKNLMKVKIDCQHVAEKCGEAHDAGDETQGTGSPGMIFREKQGAAAQYESQSGIARHGRD